MIPTEEKCKELGSFWWCYRRNENCMWEPALLARWNNIFKFRPFNATGYNDWIPVINTTEENWGCIIILGEENGQSYTRRNIM